MPVKWDADKDKFILNCLLLDPTINIGSAAIESIISSWPTEFGDVPTKKAVTEHFLKIRKSNKKFTDGAATPTVGTPVKANKTAKPRATPVKKTNGNGNGVKTPTSKRKREVIARGSDEEDDDEDSVPVLKKELDGLDGEDGDVSPSKRQRTKVKYEEEDEGAQDSGSEFAADEA
ncbi:hypothetical protein BDV97DRAFT_223381 [Delphinella strobiligena]|nr:hypothetical protein BDV97DRAFT_223381 [Delphinella strobiligena]